MAPRLGSRQQTKPVRLILIRHGLTPTTGKVIPGTMPGLHLSDEGRAQAEKLAAALKSEKIDAIFSSPLERAVETARPLAKSKSLPVRRMGELADVDPGVWEGRPLKSLTRTRHWEVMTGRAAVARFPGGESFTEAAARVMSAAERIVGEAKKGSVVAVSHADPIKLIVALMIGLPLDFFQRLEVAPGSISEIAVGRLSASLVRLNASPWAG